MVARYGDKIKILFYKIKDLYEKVIRIINFLPLNAAVEKHERKWN